MNQEEIEINECSSKPERKTHDSRNRYDLSTKYLVYNMYHKEGKSRKEIAEITGIPYPNIFSWCLDENNKSYYDFKKQRKVAIDFFNRMNISLDKLLTENTKLRRDNEILLRKIKELSHD